MITKKVVLLGDFATGKTSLIRRYVDHEFSDEYLSTIGVKISKKIIPLEEGNTKLEIQLMIWDIEGSQSSKVINPAYIMGAHGLLIVADITKKNSIENIGIHLEDCMKITKNIPIFLTLNKLDLVEDSQRLELTLSNLKSMYPEFEYIYTTSAKTGENVEDIFLNLCESMITKRQK